MKCFLKVLYMYTSMRYWVLGLIVGQRITR